MKRRELTQWIGVGMLASSLPMAIAACQSGNRSAATRAGGVADPQEFVAMGTVADLDAAGVLANRSLQGNNVVVIRNPTAPNTLIAINARCTHAGCTVEWNRDRALFICPCHGAQYEANGTVRSGPTSQPLGTYAVRVEQDQVLIGL